MKKLSALLTLCLLSVLLLTACDLSEYANQFSGFLEYLPTSSAEPSGAVGETAAPKPAETQKESQPVDTEPEADAHVHSFSKWIVTKTATCTEEGSRERTCECGEKETAKLKKASHRYTSATCDAPQTCRQCGATKGEARGHNWLPNYCLMTCRGCGITKPSGEDHAWRTFGCQKTCRGCSITMPSGEDHLWSRASCDAPKTCHSCGITEGEPLSHIFFFNQCRLCGLIDQDNWSVDNTMWLLDCIVDGKPVRWALEFYKPPNESSAIGSLFFASSQKIDAASLDQYKGREVIQYGNDFYVLTWGDEDKIAYEVSGNTVTVTGRYSDTAITLLVIPEKQKLQVVKASGSWAIPVGESYTPDPNFLH